MTNYNRLIIIGNGFDLACGMKTTYADFLHWYLIKAIKVTVDTTLFKDENIELYDQAHFLRRIDIERLRDSPIEDIIAILQTKNILKKRSPLFKAITTKDSGQPWGDIEQVYFDLLINDPDKHIELNNSLERLKIELTNYIKEIDIPSPGINVTLSNKMFDTLKNQHYFRAHGVNAKEAIAPDKFLIVNFNYTNISKRLDKPGEKGRVSIVNIHGQANDLKSVIFGYGDESHEEYPRLENLNKNQILQHFKGFSYANSFKLSQLQNFIDYIPYECFIVGHSCGLSDRILLKSIFEHENCKAIQIFGRPIEGDFQDRYISLSRHFSDKNLMRRKVLPKNSICQFLN